LNLENNKLGNTNTKIILDQLISVNRSIKVINLSNNFLNENVADVFKDLLFNNHHLNELYLHWNNLKPKGVINYKPNIN